MSNIVCFAYTAGRYAGTPNADPDNPIYDRFMRDASLLQGALRERGIEIIISTGGPRSFGSDSEEGHIFAHPTAPDGKLLPARTFRVSDTAVIVNRTSVPLTVPGARTMVNNAKVYANYGEDKLRTSRDLLEPHNLGLPTLPIATLVDLDAAVEQFGSSGVALKPRKGSLTEGVYLPASLDEAHHLVDVEAVPGGSPYLVQPLYDFTDAWPWEIKSISNDQGAPLGALYLPGMPKELRFYFWLNALPGQKAQVVCYPVGCAETESTTRMTPAGRRWIGLDPASVPQRLYDGTAAAARTLGELTSSRAIFGCIDWGYGYAAGSRQEPGWNAVEGNFCGPRVLGPREYSQIGPILHEHHVDFIARAAGSN